ncbi:hypothetical protein [Paenibacillus azoreducens]|uniref:Lipoprotein n=1 Tax=Paenibacillus azoreducens TaxID=116718 RepID=A0A919YLM5_9BACL|nr:hypothetical protein [Paenibacillus azoreducens]GIO51633.1 hypothetical protein J34TS1_63980 [Paenibacillus azoreducens]
MNLYKTAITIAIISLLTGCGSGSAAIKEELASTKETLTRLQSENESLKKELDDLKYGPETLLKEANSYFASGDIKKLKKTQETISKKYPGSGEENKIRALTEKLQKQIDDRAQQEKKEAEKQAAEEKKRQAVATAEMRKRTDDVTGYTVFEDKTSPEYINENGFYAFFAQGNDGVPILYARFQYTGDSWLFINNYTIKADDKIYEISPKYSDVHRDNDGGEVWEYYSTAVNKDVYEIINAVIKSNKTIIRSQGNERKQDRTVTAKEKAALQHVLDAYRAMGGTDSQFKL